MTSDPSDNEALTDEAEESASSLSPEQLDTPIPEGTLGDLLTLIRSASITASYSGPLPPPAMLQGFDEIVPGAAERILRIAEIEQAARIERVKEQLSSEIAATKRGQWFAFIIALAAMLLAAYLVREGESAQATGVVISMIALLAGVYFINRHAEADDE